ncbi:MAG: hypothetical protein GF411_13640 [Candidatus Lokiarchaeota archaeon]|nr:hypothetical protein [Candidatus Lokiarchaeota archaeon]
MKSSERCESCGDEIGQLPPAKTLEENYARDEQMNLGICTKCFEKRFKVISKKRSGYGGTIFELEKKDPPRFGLGSKAFSCLRCSWVAWTEEGMAVHVKKKHS